MSRVVALALLLAMAAAPAARAQVAPMSEVTLSGLPITQTVNETSALIEVQVTLSLQNMVCIGSGSSFTFPVAVAATLTNGSRVAAVEVQPATVKFEVPPGVGFIQGYTNTQSALIIVRHTGSLTEPATVKGDVTATLASAANGCQGGSAPADSAAGNFTVKFVAPPGIAGTPIGQGMPMPGAVVVLATLGLLAFALRRK